MSIKQQQPDDLRAKAAEFEAKACRVQDSELQAQFLDLAHRYIELAKQLERDSHRTPVMPGLDA